ncbi:pilus assembly protein FimV [Aeromonas salmonicida subsp. achromogenes]|uniref:FimV/HubP family polar landmark protein n=1 Tax=Aeromonas salmonicida TaxID=645 RepID=UPI00037ADC1B|nr:FimV/HubP family polar landmark protein [Aeromonas salmonicida]TMX08874.1 pilus assembly protein FimV [Aeromonas salmonicida subsp. achromogenes]TMX10485.1 pilus assembly protein FimV [Aeromonas salmonicida subsp. achromogenes]TMX11247.1 pilus assembly protein FimV [Aeromonas salmonicida subsp. achromogenes]TMX18836.1 pilus assembly protein FimV [Aeromonas salmonicida subsp. achromogenes]
MGHSRITLAMLLALGLLGTAQAEDPAREPFFVELKGPDEPAPPAVNSQPLAQPVAAPRATSQPSRPTAQPIVRQVASNAGSYGPVRPTDTLWSLASKHRPSNCVSVYQTMVAIYEKNPRSFADGNINHILVGSRILLPTAAEASVITDAQARQRFNSDNANWKGLSPKYLASKQTQPAKPAAPKVAVAPAKAPVPKAAPIPAPAPKVAAPQPATEVKEVAKAAEPVPSQAPATSAPAPLPADLGKPVGQPSTEMALALEDANAQLGQVTEMNHRLKLRLQSLTEEVETLKAQLLEQTALQKEIAELKANPVPPVAVAPESKQHWLMELLSSPLNLAMIILLPVLLVLALVTLWLRALARRELEEQEKSLSESTSMVMDQEHSEFDDLFSADITSDEPVRPMPDLNTPDGYMAMEEPAAPADIVFSDDGEMELAGFEAESAPKAAGRDPDLVPDLDLADDKAIALDVEPDLDLASEFNPPKGGHEIMSEEELQAALFAELDADLTADLDLDADDDGQPDVEAPISDEELAAFDLSDFESAFAEAEAGQESAKQSVADTSADEMLAELGLAPTKAVEPDPEWDPNELALSDFEDAFAEVESHEGDVKPREQANESGYVEIDKLLAEADATTTEQEPYQGFSLDVGLDGFPEVLPESTGFDVDADDGGVGAKLDLARAYLEIDDKDSARELLQEAAEQGSDHQRAEAEKLLKRLG